MRFFVFEEVRSGVYIKYMSTETTIKTKKIAEIINFRAKQPH